MPDFYFFGVDLAQLWAKSGSLVDIPHCLPIIGVIYSVYIPLHTNTDLTHVSGQHRRQANASVQQKSCEWQAKIYLELKIMGQSDTNLSHNYDIPTTYHPQIPTNLSTHVLNCQKEKKTVFVKTNC